MDRSKKLEIISGIAERLNNELNELKAWIKLEFAEELNPAADPAVNHHVTNFEPKNTTNTELEEETPQNPSDENLISIDNSHHIIVDTMDIKNEEMDFNEQDHLSQSQSMSSDCDPFQSFNENQEELQYQNQYNDQDQDQDQLNVKSISSTSTSSRASSNLKSKEKDSPLKSIMDKFILKKSSAKTQQEQQKNKKPPNYCSICQIRFPSNPLYREHEQIHFKVPVDYKFIESQKGNALLEADGFLYHYNLKRSNTIYWKCAIKSCPARAISNNDGENLRLTGDHNHNRDEKKVRPSTRKRRKINKDDEVGPSINANAIDTSDSDGQQISPGPSSGRSSKSKNNDNEVLIAGNDFIDQVYGDGID